MFCLNDYTKNLASLLPVGGETARLLEALTSSSNSGFNQRIQFFISSDRKL